MLALNEANLVNQAKLAMTAGDPVAALHFWQEALVRYPGFAKSSADAFEIELGLKRFDEAETLMLEGQKRAPRDPYYAANHALVAERRGHTEDAIQRWNRVREKYPRYGMGYGHGMICLRRAGKLEAAEALGKQAVRLFPSDLRIWLEWARTAEHRRDWPEARSRWEAIREKFHHVQSDIGLAHALAELGRIEEAERLLMEAQGHHPLIEIIATGLAQLAEKRGDPEEAVRRWAATRRRFPLFLSGYQGEFRQLLVMGRHADAEALLLATIDRFPAEAWPAVEYASLAHTLQDWAAAAARWAAVREGWPDRHDGYLRGAEALAALGRQDDAAQIRAEHQRRFAH